MKIVSLSSAKSAARVRTETPSSRSVISAVAPCRMAGVFVLVA